MPLPSPHRGVGLLATFKKALVLDAARKQHGLLTHLRPDAVVWKCRAIRIPRGRRFGSNIKNLQTFDPMIYDAGLRRDPHSPPARGGGAGAHEADVRTVPGEIQVGQLLTDEGEDGVTLRVSVLVSRSARPRPRASHFLKISPSIPHEGRVGVTLI